MISEISKGFTPLSSASFKWYDISALWFRAISAAIVTMLRSRGLRPGRFQRPAREPSAYFCSAGATDRTASWLGVESEVVMALLSCA
jgi:hypothetical protein